MSQILDGVATQPRKQLNARQISFLLFVISLHTLPIIAILTGAHLIDPLACVGFSLLYSFGLGGCLHRYFAHRTFKTSRAFQFIMCLLVGMTFGDPIWFAGGSRHEGSRPKIGWPFVREADVVRIAQRFIAGDRTAIRLSP